MLTPLAQQLVTAGFGHFAIAQVANLPDESLVLLHHPMGEHHFDSRQAFLAEAAGLRVDLHSEVADDDDDNRHYTEVRSSLFDQGWGKMRYMGGREGETAQLQLGVYGIEGGENLQQAITKAWVTCSDFTSVRWDFNYFGFGSYAVQVSTNLFANFQERWIAEPGDPERIFIAIRDRGLYDIARQAMLDHFGSRHVTEPDTQLTLF